MIKEYKLWNAGYCRYVNHMGDDNTPLIAARMSTLNPTGIDETKDDQLRDYLYRHNHCYHPNMQVLTSSGWINWSDAKEFEEYIIPNPNNNMLKREILKLESFDYDGEMYVFENKRISYNVTKNHRMWFKSKSSKQYKIYKVEEMPNWGHFQPIKDYQYIPEKYNNLFAFVGFYLGDGSISHNRLFFNLKKERKITLLKNLIEDLNLDYKIRVNLNGVNSFSVEIPHGFLDLVGREKCKEKKLLIDIFKLNQEELYGLYFGLCNSDGSLDKKSGSYYFSTTSNDLNKLFETTSSLLGIDCHETSFNKSKGLFKYVSTNSKNRTSLERREHFSKKEKHSGKVFCTTSSTGLLIVRGNSRGFAFISGNTSVFEQADIVVEVQVPIFVARQLVRHRTFSLNEFSLRYSEPLHLYYIPDPSIICGDNKSNKQGSGEQAEKEIIRKFINHATMDSVYQKEVYEEFREAGVSKEVCRQFQPVSAYTRLILKCNLRNWYHFLSLRMKPEAQTETRQLAETIFNIIKDLFPKCTALFEEHTLYAEKFSKTEIDLIKQMIYNYSSEWGVNTTGLTGSKLRDFKSKLGV